MAKARKTTNTRLSATIINPTPVSADNEVRMPDPGAPAKKPLLSELPVADLLNDLREVDRRGSEAMGELQRRYGGFVERRLRKQQVHDWCDRETLAQDLWMKVQAIVRRAPGSRGAWDPERVGTAADPIVPLLSAIAGSKAKDYHKSRASRRRKFEAFAEEFKNWGDDVGDYAFTRPSARRRIAAKEVVSKEKKDNEPKVLEGRLKRRLAAAARPRLHELMAGLPEDLRLPLLRKAEGRTCDEIAAEIGVAPSQASKRSTKARLELIECLEGKPVEAHTKKRAIRRERTTARSAGAA